MQDKEYFAAKSGTETAEAILEKANMWSNNLYMNGYLDKIKEMWMAYHGAYYRGASDGHQILFGGEQGELVSIAVNHLRNIAQNILVMITSNRPAFQARATNTDYKSLSQTRLANDLLDYYMRDKRLEKYLKTAVEYAIVMGSGYIKMDWNATSGETYDFNEETQTPIFEGDVEFTNLSPFDVVVDSTKESQNHDWIMCRTYKNRHDLVAKFPELKEKILALPTKTDIYKYRFDVMTNQETDDIPVHEFYHKRTESMPDGRYLLFLSGTVILMDTPMPYRTLPIYRISPSDILGTPFGYTPLFDLLPIQDAINMLYSTILTNQHAFGVQNIYVPRGADVTVSALSGGLNVIEGNAAAGKPEAMNLTATPPEVFNFLKMLETAQETISGVNSVSRGNPESSLKSGTALALVQSMTLQFISGLQESYVELIEDVGTGLINMLKDFASVPKVAMIAGKSNRSFLEHTFTGDDLSEVNRVIVDVGNPLARTTAGKVQLAESLIQYGIIKTPEEYFTVLNTGNLSVLDEYQQNELLLIRAENEKLSEGSPVTALAIDEHITHIKEHKGILSDPDMRMNPTLVQSCLNHINEHIQLLRTTDPALLTILGEQPLGPAGGSPPPQQAPASMNNQAKPPSAGPIAPPHNGAPPPNMPKMPGLPKSPNGLPVLASQKPLGA
jgi:hypothetical protein